MTDTANTPPVSDWATDYDIFDAGYIAEMTKDLKGLAANAELEFLAYLLSVAEEEARGIHRRMRSREAPATAPPLEYSQTADDMT